MTPLHLLSHLLETPDTLPSNIITTTTTTTTSPESLPFNTSTTTSSDILPSTTTTTPNTLPSTTNATEVPSTTHSPGTNLNIKNPIVFPEDPPTTQQVPTTPEHPIVFPEDPPTTPLQDVPTNTSSLTFPTTTLPDTTLDPEAEVFTNYSKEFLECLKVLLNEDDFVELSNGTVHVPVYGRTYSPRDYQKYGDGGLVVCHIMEEASAEIRKFSDALGWVSLVGLSLSCLCLLLHMSAFALLPELRNPSGRNLASLCLALLAAYITMLVNMVSRTRATGCVILAVAMYYFFVTSFTWMNVIAFDVWYTFRLTQRQLRVSSGAQWHRFIAYSLYSWLLPGAATVVLVLVDQIEPSGLPEELLPRLGKTWCWFSHRKALLAFFAAPMMFLIVMNFVFFVSTAVIITQTSSTAAASSARGNNPRGQYKMYLRLGVLMGFTWVSGIAAGYLDLEALWYVFVVLNTLQGVFIFLAFTFRTRVWQGMGATLTKLVQRGLSKVTRRSPPPDIQGFELSHTPETTSASCYTPSNSLEDY
ncbi:G-protein coupled receptor Mth2 [Portunus trituberculatus]|uniref:G-protein coupled receptor Mth2 n=1 Tax=Portunus trituberculatus TaxID=210409 RepID=A0A5B7DF47_PORTR|nr:G-protein coupled receptor Mth2 [Portunus trituberculatus]